MKHCEFKLMVMAGALALGLAAGRALAQAPVITSFTVAPQPAIPGQTVTFAVVASDAYGSIGSYAFDFGDGTPVQTVSSQTITHEYLSQGVYTASVVVRDNGGKTSSRTVPVYITAAPNSLVILSTSPTGNNADVSSVVIATFDDNIDPSSVNQSSIVLRKAGVAVPGNVTVSGNTVLFTPSSPLDYETAYSATVSGSVRSVFGSTIGQDYPFNFTTANRFLGLVRKNTSQRIEHCAHFVKDIF